MSIWSGVGESVDDQDLHLSPGRVQLQSKLFLKRGEDREGAWIAVDPSGTAIGSPDYLIVLHLKGCADEEPRWNIRGDKTASRLRHHHHSLVAGGMQFDGRHLERPCGQF